MQRKVEFKYLPIEYYGQQLEFEKENFFYYFGKNYFCLGAKNIIKEKHLFIKNIKLTDILL